MPEIPEIASRAREMQNELIGRSIKSIEILQPKCLNILPSDFINALIGATIQSVDYHGKWIKVMTTKGWLLINLGMGGEILLTKRETLPIKYMAVFDFADGNCLAINFWWFGYVHYCSAESLAFHPNTSKLGPNILDLSEEAFTRLFTNQKGRVKAFLLDQTKVAGIGNAYIHDILFFAKMHPNTPIKNLQAVQVHELFQAIQAGLRPSLELGGAFYEKNLHGQPGGFTLDKIIIGYRANTPCPVCGTPIQKIKTGSTSSFICPHCQPEV